MTKIIIEPKTARLYRDLDAFGKMDPYCTIQCGSEKKKTKTHNGGGKNPTWSDAISIKAMDDTMTLTVWDKDVGKDDYVGSASIDINKITYSGGLKDWVSIYHKGKEAGQVYVEISVAGSSSSYGHAAPGYAAPPTYYAPPAPAYPGGYASAPGGYAPAPGGYAPAPGGYAPAPGGYAPAPSHGYAPAPAPAYPGGHYSAPAPAYPGGYSQAPAPAPAPGYGGYSQAPAPAPQYPGASGGYPGAPGGHYQAPGYGGGYQ